MRRGNHRRVEKLTNEGADGRLEVPVAVTGWSKRELSIEKSQPPAIGEANQRRRGRKTGRYDSCAIFHSPGSLHPNNENEVIFPAVLNAFYFEASLSRKKFEQ
nr:unnamed protein product [Spirometra erinaceieuropaei]